jgi:hypothetical protein
VRWIFWGKEEGGRSDRERPEKEEESGLKESHVNSGRRRKRRDERSSHEAQSCGIATDALVKSRCFLEEG